MSTSELIILCLMGLAGIITVLIHCRGPFGIGRKKHRRRNSDNGKDKRIEDMTNSEFDDFFKNKYGYTIKEQNASLFKGEKND